MYLGEKKLDILGGVEHWGSGILYCGKKALWGTERSPLLELIFLIGTAKYKRSIYEHISKKIL